MFSSAGTMPWHPLKGTEGKIMEQKHTLPTFHKTSSEDLSFDRFSPHFSHSPLLLLITTHLHTKLYSPLFNSLHCIHVVVMEQQQKKKRWQSLSHVTHSKSLNSITFPSITFNFNNPVATPQFPAPHTVRGICRKCNRRYKLRWETAEEVKGEIDF